MGIQAKSHMEQVFKAPYIADGTHPVPVSNFLNAQCMCFRVHALHSRT
jgi:saccharopepsin